MAIRGQFTVKRDDSVGEILELLKGRRSFAQIREALLRGVEAGNLQLLARIQKERLTGSGPFPVSQKRLGVVSGRLRRSMRFSRPTFDRGILRTSVGTNVVYFGKHEFGGGGRQVRVKAAKVKAHTKTKLFGRRQRVEIPAHTRKAYTRKDNTPKREPVQAALREHATRIYGITLEKTLRRVLERGTA
jgi:hypothetical protein